MLKIGYLHLQILIYVSSQNRVVSDKSDTRTLHTKIFCYIIFNSFIIATLLI